MILDVFNKNKKSDYEVYIYEGDVLYKKGCELDKEKKYIQAKEFFQKAGQSYFAAYNASSEPKDKNDAYKKYKSAESMFYAMNYRPLLEKAKKDNEK